MPLVQTRGAASAQGFGEFAQVSVPNYIEDVFSCFLYTGNGSTQTITNNIDLSTKGGLTWIKGRSGATDHALYDTARGATFDIASNLTNVQTTQATGLTAFGTTGFSIGALAKLNTNAATYVSWTFRKQPKFFDVVTYTGTGSNTTVAHALGSVPGCIIVKRTDISANWAVYHRSLANTQYLFFNNQPAATGATWWNSTTPTSSVFSLGTDASVNASGGTYVAYIFAHDAGGFGLTGTDNVISCGSFTTDGSGNATVSLGYEPQWIMTKNSSAAGYQWQIWDSMRGLTVGSNDRMLQANLTNSEENNNVVEPSATGFSYGVGPASNTFIYITLRRGPMKVPTLGTSVFKPNAYTGTGAVLPITGMGFPPDFLLTIYRGGGNDWCAQDKLRGPSQYLRPNGNIAELNLGTAQLVSIDQDGVTYGNGSSLVNFSGATYINLSFRRAPSFFDEVCYTGTGANRTVTHNLAAVPELMIVKGRSIAERWSVYSAPTTATAFLILDGTTAATTNNFFWNDTAPTSSVFTLGTQARVNDSGSTYVAYLFATCAGVSKVGSYTGYAGYTVTVPCGFTSGVRFVLIKRTDSTGDWWVYDSARGITSGNDPYLYLNSTDAEVGGTDYIDSYSAGFEVTSTAPAGLNATGGTYIFLAIA